MTKKIKPSFVHTPILIITFLLTLTSCGRKNNNFLVFEEKEKPVKVNPLTLPSVRGLNAKETSKNKIELSWLAAKTSDEATLVGYNVYRFYREAFIPRKPLNSTPITTTSYSDKISAYTLRPICYVVRPIFRMHDRAIEGPATAPVSPQ